MDTRWDERVEEQICLKHHKKPTKRTIQKEGRKEASMATVRKTNTRTNGGNTLDLDFVSTYISGASRDNPR